MALNSQSPPTVGSYSVDSPEFTIPATLPHDIPSPSSRSPSPHYAPSEPEESVEEASLREAFANEEIERFLRFFNAYVTEVHDPSGAADSVPAFPESLNDAESIESDSDQISTTAEGEKYISRRIAELFLPYLPPPSPPAPAFTISRLRQSAQRYYLALEPTYLPLIKAGYRLASWQNPQRSLLYCAGFWILWWHNFLLPALLLRIIYALWRRRFLPYPTLKELQEHRAQLDRASEFGQQLQKRLAATSTLGVKDAWTLFRVLNKDKKQRLKATAKAVGIDAGSGSGSRVDVDSPTVVDDEVETKEERDIKRLALTIMNEISDLHERLKNLFRWRRPGSSRIYGCALILLFVATATMSAQMLAKCVYLVLGVFFWHVTPVILSLSPEEGRRLPPAFGDLPTDADYAMELISQRVAAGLDVRTSAPRNRRSHRHHEAAPSISNTSLPELLNRSGPSSPPPLPPRRTTPKGADWAKWGQRAATGIHFANDLVNRANRSPQPPSSPVPGSPGARQEAPRPRDEVTHSFPAQHSTMPGLVTLTATHLYFSSLVSTEARISFALSQVKGVKKVGVLNIKGLTIVWSQDGVEKEEKFRWVGGRDELFARLVAVGTSRWVRS